MFMLCQAGKPIISGLAENQIKFQITVSAGFDNLDVETFIYVPAILHPFAPSLITDNNFIRALLYKLSQYC
jgi:hypothetical protein